MRRSLRKGFSFGLTSGIITTLGLIVGLNSVSDSVIILIEGILIIAISDSMSDALGIHISEESENKYSNKAVWESTLATLLTKFVFAISFIIPLLLLEKSIAVIISVIWGLGLIAIMSYYIAKRENQPSISVIGEHLLIAIIVIILTNYVGLFISWFV